MTTLGGEIKVRIIVAMVIEEMNRVWTQRVEIVTSEEGDKIEVVPEDNSEVKEEVEVGMTKALILGDPGLRVRQWIKTR